MKYYERELKKKVQADSPDVERKIATPETEDMRTLADGGLVDLDVEESEIVSGEVVESNRPHSPGGSGDPVIYDEED